MAIIHNKLYTNPEYDKVDFNDYIKTLTQNLFLSYGASPSAVKLEIDVNGIFLNIDTAIPCGLIINELISNSLKYAFPQNGNGKINIKMFFEKNDLMLIVKDDGIGIDNNLFSQKNETLGLKLVQLLASQMDGKVDVYSLKGTEFKIRFKELHYKKRT
jgi:two-component sensor histidine kinase